MRGLWDLWGKKGCTKSQQTILKSLSWPQKPPTLNNCTTFSLATFINSDLNLSVLQKTFQDRGASISLLRPPAQIMKLLLDDVRRGTAPSPRLTPRQPEVGLVQ